MSKFVPYGDLRTDYLNSKPADFQSGIDVEAWNEDLVDITSYVPLDIRMKQMERAGIRCQLSASDFTISELRQIYDNHDYEYTRDDDLEDIISKENARKALMAEILAKKAQENAEILAKKAQENSGLAPEQKKDVPQDKDVSASGEAKNLT